MWQSNAFWWLNNVLVRDKLVRGSVCHNSIDYYTMGRVAMFKSEMNIIFRDIVAKYVNQDAVSVWTDVTNVTQWLWKYRPILSRVHLVYLLDLLWLVVTQHCVVIVRIGRQCPPMFNPADYCIHQLAIIPNKETECREFVRVSWLIQSHCTTVFSPAALRAAQRVCT